MIISRVQRSFGTHDGAFHADDVMACALLLFFKVIDRDKIIRTRDIGRIETCDFVCDVGGEYDAKRRRFDHHQHEYIGKQSSAGMIWVYLKEQKIVDVDLYEYLNKQLVHGIDEIDNGINFPPFGHTTFSQVIAAFVPASHETDDNEMDEAFERALDFSLGHLERVIDKYEYIKSCSHIVKEVMAQMDECLVFDRAIPWLEAFFDNGGESHSAEFVLMPAKNHWKLRGIPPSYEKRMDVKRSFPKNWLGLIGEDLEKVSGISGSIFCHKGGFISIWETKEAALKALKHVLGS